MLNKNIKLELFNAVKHNDDFLGTYRKDTQIMNFLSNIWPLRTLPSKDPRFKNAYDDTVQHYINNEDWNTEELFLGRFDLVETQDDQFKSFIHQVVHPIARSGINDIDKYVRLFNDILQKANHSLKVVDYFNELPVYKISEGLAPTVQNRVMDANSIPFFKSDDRITQYPAFVLRKDNWNDYGYVTQMWLRYYASEFNYEELGSVKIMKTEVTVTWDVLHTPFITLEDDYCSLGQSLSYYKTFQRILPESYQSILLALRDVGIYPRVYDTFHKDAGFMNSLVRKREAASLSTTARYLLHETRNLFKFNFLFRPPFGGDIVNLYFDFEHQGDFQHRIYAVIGKNGTGKTAMLTGIARFLSESINGRSQGEYPLYGKIFTVSYSVFDRFPILEANDAFNYVYCGLRLSDGTIKSFERQLKEFESCYEKIYLRELDADWFIILSKFLSEEVLLALFPNHESQMEYSAAKIDRVNARSIIEKMSSGETIFLFTITRIVSEIRDFSLLLYDEPETHLHPNAVTALMNALFTLVSRFKSFCIIATHSPIIVRELTARDVIVLKREDNELSVRSLEKDSFAENLTVITEEIFGAQDINKNYMEQLQTMVQNKLSYENIVGKFCSGDLPLSLNARLYLRSLINDAQ